MGNGKEIKAPLVIGREHKKQCFLPVSNLIASGVRGEQRIEPRVKKIPEKDVRVTTGSWASDSLTKTSHL